MIKNSFIFPILFWNWYGYEEWILIDELIQEYSIDFEKVKNRIIRINNLDPDRKKFESNIILDFNQLPKEEVAKCTLSILSEEGDFLIGKEYILMRKGTLEKMRIYLNGMIDTAEEMNRNLKEKLIRIKIEKENKKNKKSRKSAIFIPSKLEEKIGMKFEGNNRIRYSSKENKNISKENLIKYNDLKLDYEDFPLPNKKQFVPLNEDNSRRHLLKEQCILNIISNGKIINSEEKQKIIKSKAFNLYYLISHRDRVLGGLENDIKDDFDLEELEINLDKIEKESKLNDNSLIKTKKSFEKGKNKSTKEFSNSINNIIKIQS